MTEVVRYTVRCLDLQAHLFEVMCRIPRPAADGQRVSLPAWIPGSYLVRDFARHIVSLSARDARGEVAVSKQSKDSWRCAPARGALELRAEIHAHDPSVREAWLDERRGFFNGSSLLLLVDGQRDQPAELAIEPVASQPTWQVYTAMPAVQVDSQGFGVYRAANYDELIDHPVALGDATVLQFEARGVPHRFAIFGRHRVDGERFTRDLSRVCAWQIDLFGTPPTIDRYLFLGQAEGDGYGGLEHRHSSALVFRRSDLPQPGQERMDPGYRRLLGLCAHEYFHLWLVKRILPAAFVPYDLAAENYTRMLWVFEGITSYYQNLSLLRSGLIDLPAFCELLGQTITRVRRAPGRLRQTLAESSFDAWIKLYKPDENSANAGISYYTKGVLVALALDLTIRRGTRGRKSLDDVLRALWVRFGVTAEGMPEDAFERAAEEVSGLALDDFFAQSVHATAELPLADLLADAGLVLRFREASVDYDAGGSGPGRDAPLPVWVGADWRGGDGRLQLTTVFAGGPAERAGLAAGDELLAIDGWRVGGGSMAGLLVQYRPGDTVPVVFYRGDELLMREIEFASRPADTAYIQIEPEPSAEAARLRREWLSAGEQTG